LISPQLRALGTEIRLLAVFLDAISAYGRYCVEVQGRVDTALLTEEHGEGWHGDHAVRTLREWGVVDQHGVYLVAGLTKRQTEVAFMYYDRQLEPVEIAKYLRLDPHTVRVHLQAAEERLRRLAA
jgi:DNA-directed RNA polymerase specialized sigma24 family protein